MAADRVWRGRKGAVLLGPTEDRVARYLASRTANGRAVIRTVDLMEATGIPWRSAIYRVTARLRILGVFGIRNDRGGTLGGRWYWRTATRHQGAALDPVKHRAAWSRILGGARARARRVAAFMRDRGAPEPAIPSRPAGAFPAPAGPTFRDLFAAAPGGAELLAEWKR